jgi:aerotaxis receptor
MRQNLPVTNREVLVLDDQAIVSKTDMNGNIVYVNPYFSQVSGFTEAELLGSPQNIVRHPDMPAEAFADLWTSIQAGTPWTGLVKNRCKNGDFYWVRANVTPIREAGKTIGYMSVRVKADKDQVKAAEEAYAAIRNKEGGNIVIKHGQIVRPGLAHLLHNLTHMSLNLRIWAATSIVNCLQLLVCVISLFASGGKITNYAIFGATLFGFLIS